MNEEIFHIGFNVRESKAYVDIIIAIVWKNEYNKYIKGVVALSQNEIENTKVEKKAIWVLEGSINDCEYLDYSFNSMDKELSWDGYIYVYNNKKFSNNTLEDKISVQIKGNILCAEGRIPGATRMGNIWVIPVSAQKPKDERIKLRKYIKKEKDL